MTQQTQKPKETEKDSTQKVIDAAKELYELGFDVTREALKSATDLPMSIVDERIRTLIYEERMVRVERGKYEVGYQVTELSPREDRVLAGLTGGALVKLVGVEGHRVAMEANDLMLKQLENIEKMSRALWWVEFEEAESREPHGALWRTANAIADRNKGKAGFGLENVKKALQAMLKERKRKPKEAEPE